jgi:F-type H+-transporting ATPase subunit delta
MQTKAETIEHYADALVAIGKAANALRVIEDDFVHLLDFMQESEALQRFLASATVAQTGKRRALQEILKGQSHPLLVEFLIMLLTAGELGELETVAKRFFEKASQVHERISGEIHVAVPLSDHHLADIETEIGRILDKQVTLRARIMPGVLGGVLIKVGDFIVDGTLDRQLEDARRQLLV